MEEEKQNKNYWKNIAIFFIGAVVLLILFISTLLIQEGDQYSRISGIIGAVGIFSALVLIFLINNTVGFNFIIMINRLKKLKSKGWLMLRVHNITGKVQHILAKNSTWISYTYKENGVDTNKRLLSDPLAKYNEFAADIPILDCTPNDAFPKNPHTGQRVTTSPELIDKHIIDASKTAHDLEKYKGYVKLLLPVAGVLMFGMVVMFDLWRQSIDSANERALEAAKICGQSAIVTAKLFLIGRIKKDDER